MKYPWKPFEDIEERLFQYRSEDLGQLLSIWNETKAGLKDSKAYRDFTEKNIRRHAIETGIIERIYDLDRGITEILVEEGIKASYIQKADTSEAERIAAIIEDQKSAVEGIFDFVAQRRELSVSYIKELHALVTRNQDSTLAKDMFGNLVKTGLIRGAFKKLPNNPKRENGFIHQYCPPKQTDSEMDRLIELHLLHQTLKVSPELEAAWLHHRFTQIHLFRTEMAE
jgi:Fic family protein